MWDGIPSGQTVVGTFTYVQNLGLTGIVAHSINLPAAAPSTPTFAFAPDAYGATTDDAACTGTPAAPTAPPGMFCAYVYDLIDVNTLSLLAFPHLPNTGVTVSAQVGTFADVSVGLTWAYTAP